MRRMTKVALGATALAVGVGGISVSLNPASQANGAASASPYSISFGSGSGLTKYVSGTTSYTSGGVTWTIANVPAYVANDPGDWHLGSGKKALKDFTISAAASNFGTAITSVTVKLNGGNSNTISISGNGTSAVSGKAVPTTQGNITANFETPVSSGDLVITLNENNSQTAATYLYSISVTYATGDVPATGIALSQTSLSGVEGGSDTLTATLTPANTTHGIVDWSTNNPAVATVSAGVVNYVAAGNAVIKATVHDDTTLEATCAITVAAAQTYSLVTSLSNVYLGAEIVFVNKTSSKAMADTIVNSSYLDQVAITVGENSVKEVDNIGVFTFGIGATKDTYTFKNKTDSKYLTTGSSGSALILASGESTASDWSIGLGEGGVASISANSRSLFYNTTYSDFASSATAATTGQEIYLYQKAASASQLDSVETTGTLTKSKYKPGDIFDASGLTINGMFNDSNVTIANLTAWVVWPTTPIVLGQTSVDGTVTVGSVSKTITQAITVEEVTLSKIEITTPATLLKFAVGQQLDTTGLVVTATYSNNTTEDITAKCTISPANGSSLTTAGTQTITITYLSKTASYDITVETAAYSLKKITSTDQLAVGAQIVIANADQNVAISSTQNSSNRGQEAIAPASDTLNLLSTSKAGIFTLGVGTASETYSFKDSVGYLCAGSSSSNTLKSEDTLDTNGNGNWEISFNNGVASIIAKGTYTRNVLQYNSGSSIFSCYSSASQKDVVLYEQVKYYNAASWAASFNTVLDTTCSNTAPTAISQATWDSQTTAYGNLSTDEKALLKAVDLASNPTTTSIGKAISRYDYVMTKTAYSAFADFIGRFPSRGASGVNELTKSSSPENVLYITLGIGLVAAGSFYIFSRKKKEA